MVQSNAESPPPAIITFLSLKVWGSLMKYKTPLSSNFWIPSKVGFLGWNPPSPPAITTIGALWTVPLSVITLKLPSWFFINFSAFSPNVNPGLN